MNPVLLSALLLVSWTPDLLDDPDAWRARPDWSGTSAADRYSLDHGQVWTFSVIDPQAAMKWRRELRPSPLELTPYLILEMRATDMVAVEDQYLLWLDEGSPDGRGILGLGEAPLDGQWHTLCLDLRRLGVTSEPSAAAVQVIAGDADASLDVRRLELAPTPPDGAEMLPPEPPDAPVELPLGDPRGWMEQPSWLGNPGEARVTRADGSLEFRVTEAGAGMKWSIMLPEPIDVPAHSYVTLTYQAAGGGASDYALAFLGDSERGEEYAVVCRGEELTYDGEEHVLSVRLATEPTAVRRLMGLAVQVQARPAGHGWLRIKSAMLGDQPALRDVMDTPVFGEPAAAAREVPLPAEARAVQEGATELGSAAILRAAGLTGDLPVGRTRARGIDFECPESPATLRFGAGGTIEMPVGMRGRALLLLVLAGMVGSDDPVRGSGPLRRLPGPDRFVARITYEDDVVDCVPWALAPSAPDAQWGLPEGVSVLQCPLDPEREAQSATLELMTDQVGVVLLGASVGTGPGYEASPEADLHQVALPPPSEPARPAEQPEGWYVEETDVVHLETTTTRLTVSRVGVPRILGVYHKPLGRDVLGEAVPLMEVSIDGEAVPEGWLTTTRAGAQEGGYVLAHDEGELRWRLRWETWRGSVGFSLSMALGEEEGREVSVRYPALPIDMGGRDEPAYCFPSIAPVIGSEDRKLSASYSGWGIRHPFMAVQTADGSGCLMVEARDPAVESLALAKDGRSVTLGVETRPVTLSEGGVRTVPGFSIQCLAGDWHSALEEYRGGLREPVAPRPDWVRDIWNFRQRFLGWLDPMWPDRSQPVDLWPAVREAEEQFGGIDYLHIFDWGTVPGLGRIYHRPGDPDPSEHWPGGYPAFEAAMDELQEAGIPVGLYIEGYLLETRGPLGQRIGDEVAIIDEAGEPRFWPDATEVFACPWLPMWRDIQARTYERAARNLSPSGMYIDEFGFCSTWRDCYASDHGHGVPMNQIRAEHGFVEEVREHVDTVDPGIILYTEESPPDSNAYLQDASFTYAMNQCYHAEARVPLNLYRFVHPGFKTIEILICDKPTAAWASGVAWTFFNGEAIWLEGPPQEWFAPQTLEMIRKCHGILSVHADAFSSSRVTPLVPTVVTGIHANEFVGEDEVIYTLYNEGHTSYEGPVLVVPEGFGGAATDVWSGREAVVSRAGGHRVVHARVGPRSVGCVTIARE